MKRPTHEKSHDCTRLCALAARHASVCSQKHFSGGHAGGARTRSDVFTPQRTRRKNKNFFFFSHPHGTVSTHSASPTPDAARGTTTDTRTTRKHERRKPKILNRHAAPASRHTPRGTAMCMAAVLSRRPSPTHDAYAPHVGPGPRPPRARWRRRAAPLEVNGRSRTRYYSGRFNNSSSHTIFDFLHHAVRVT